MKLGRLGKLGTAATATTVFLSSMGSAGAMTTPEFQVDQGKSAVLKLLTAPQKGADCFNPYITSELDCSLNKHQGLDGGHKTDGEEGEDTLGDEPPVDDATTGGDRYVHELDYDYKDAAAYKAWEESEIKKAEKYCRENPGEEYRSHIRKTGPGDELEDHRQVTATCRSDGEMGTISDMPTRQDFREYLKHSRV